jgi:glycosyltransferase involved in cell wall biosynthesis
MKIVHVVGTISSESSGPAQSVPALCIGLAELGMDVQLHYLDFGRRPEVPGVDTRVYPQSRFPGLRGAAWSLPLLIGLMREGTPDRILHAHGLWHFPTIYPGWAKTLRRAKLVMSPRGTLGQWPLSRSRFRKSVSLALGQRRALAIADLLHATADSEVADIRRFGLDNPVAVIPNAIPMPAAPPGDDALRQRRVLFLSRLHPKKAVDRLLAAWALVAPRWPDWHLAIAGAAEGDHLGELRRLAGELGLGTVRFLGEVLGRDKEEAYRSSSVFVLPSHHENFGIVVAEALSHGLPVIASRGTPWAILEREGGGWWVDNDPESLARALDQALALTPAARGRIGEVGRRIVRERFSRAAIAAQMKSAYERVAAGDRFPDA